MSFISPFRSKLVLTLREDVTIRSEPEKQDENQFLEKKFYNLSDFELKYSNTSDFAMKSLKRVRC